MRRLFPEINDITDMSTQMTSNKLTSSLLKEILERTYRPRESRTGQNTKPQQIKYKQASSTQHLILRIKCSPKDRFSVSKPITELLNYFSEKTVKKGDWIICQVCKTWFLEIYVDALRKKTFMYRKRRLIEIVPHRDQHCTNCDAFAIKNVYIYTLNIYLECILILT
jgi:hypothetical protein